MSRARPAHGQATSSRADEPSVACPLYHETIELIGSRWTGAILWVLMSGPMRFSAIVQAVPGMSDRLCCSRLRDLEAAGLVDRRVMTSQPGAVEYRLTRAGRDLNDALAALGRWGHRWLSAHPSDAGAFHLPRVTRARTRR